MSTELDVLPPAAGRPASEHPDAELACDAIEIAAAVRRGRTRIDLVNYEAKSFLSTPEHQVLSEHHCSAQAKPGLAYSPGATTRLARTAAQCSIVAVNGQVDVPAESDEITARRPEAA